MSPSASSTNSPSESNNVKSLPSLKTTNQRRQKMAPGSSSGIASSPTNLTNNAQQQFHSGNSTGFGSPIISTTATSIGSNNYQQHHQHNSTSSSPHDATTTKGTIPTDLPDIYLHTPLSTHHIADLFLKYKEVPMMGQLRGIEAREVLVSEEEEQQQQQENFATGTNFGNQTTGGNMSTTPVGSLYSSPQQQQKIISPSVSPTKGHSTTTIPQTSSPLVRSLGQQQQQRLSSPTSPKHHTGTKLGNSATGISSPLARNNQNSYQQHRRHDYGSSMTGGGQLHHHYENTTKYVDIHGKTAQGDMSHLTDPDKVPPPICLTSWTLESSKLLTDLKHHLQITGFEERNAFPEWNVSWNKLMSPQEIQKQLHCKNMHVRRRIFANEYLKWREPSKRTHATIAVLRDLKLRRIFFKEFLEKYHEYMTEIERNTDLEEQMARGQSPHAAQQQVPGGEHHRWNYSFPMPSEDGTVYREYMICLFGGIDEDGNCLNDCWLFDVYTGFWKEVHFDRLEEKDAFEQVFSSKRHYHQHYFEASDKVKDELCPEVASLKAGGSNKSSATKHHFSNNIRDLSFFKKSTNDMSPSAAEKSQFQNLKSSNKSLKPQQRAGHALISISDTELLLFGGKKAETFEHFNDVWILSFDQEGGAKWSLKSPRGQAPTPRWNFTWTLYNRCVYIFGGEDRNHDVLSDVACYSLDDNAWIKLKKSFPIPTARMCHASCAIRERFFVIGGIGNNSGSTSTSDVWSWDMMSTLWKKYNFEAPSPFHDKNGRLSKQLYGHQCISWEDKIIVFGGKYSQHKPNNRIWCFDSNTYKWTEITKLWRNQKPPVGRFNQALAIYNHDYVDSHLLMSNNKKDHEEFRFLVEKKKVRLPIRDNSGEDITIRRLKDVFVFGGEDDAGLFDELFRLTLRIKMQV